MKKRLKTTISRIARRILVLVLIGSLCAVGSTNAYMSDTETSGANTYHASDLDIALTDTSDTVLTTPLFAITNLKPGQSHVKDMRVRKIGTEQFTYDMWSLAVDGDSALCNTLQLKATVNGTEVYSGDMMGLFLPYPIILTSSTDDWHFETWLQDSGYALQNLSCTFKIHVKGWQVGSDGTWGFMDEEQFTNTVATGRWQPPRVPTLVSPLDGTVRNATGMVMDWEDLIDPDGLVTYVYQSAYDAGFTSIAYTSAPLTHSDIPASGTPDGTYWWHVQACNINACSAWSSTWKVIVDNTKPTSIITTGLNLNNDNDALKLHTHYTTILDWNGIIDGTASDAVGVQEVWLSIQRPILNLYWNGSAWVSGTDSSVRVKANGSTLWNYPLSNHPTGAYVIRSHAVDLAGNTEDTFTLYLDYQELPPKASVQVAPDKKSLTFKMEHITGFATFDYELKYIAYDTAKGVVGKDIDIQGLSIYEKNGISLATCSDDGCTYDGGVHEFVLRIVLKKVDGSEVVITTTD